jgi:N-acyl-D-amino-acid deacylase
VARARSRAPEEAALDLLAEADAGLVSFNMWERDVEHVMRQPWTMTCTDGDLVPLGEGKPHPRAYGAFPRKLRVYVQERGVLDWASAVRSMTGLPAAVFGLKDRGLLRPGAWADVLVIDPDRVRDVATYADPHRLAEGIDHVLVNGRLARDGGEPTTVLAGRVVSPERD